MRAVIMAGGKGTRIAALDIGVPKPMIPLLGKPIMQYGVECLVRNGITELTVATGYLAESIEGYFGDGSAFGASIRYFRESEPLGTAGALGFIKETLTEDFLLLNADIVYDIDFSRFISFHKSRGALATLFTHPNSHPYDSALIATGDDGKIERWLNKEDPRGYETNRVNAGLHIMSPELIRKIEPGSKTDLDRDILKPAVSTGGLYAYDSPEYVFDVGTPERYARVERDLQNGLPESKNLRKKQKAVFLDRDGTLNVQHPFLTKPEQLELLPGTAEAVRLINASGYLAVLVTNQPVIARGECSFETLAEIHRKLETLLGEEGAYLDGIYFCPHHPDSGFEGEVKELKIPCECRKPKPGLLLRAAEDLNIDLSASYMVGDAARDVEAGIAAGCTPVFIGEKSGLPQSLLSTRCAVDLLQFAKELTERK